ncbi:MAG: hypothetical protein JO211_15475, partial [Acidobacteriaceae bacterium]|nr:hypothetical protein [Acidobacteriaceae bacterium]
MISTAGAGLFGPVSAFAAARKQAPEVPGPIKAEDRKFLEDYAHRCFLYFWEQADDHTGIVLDRARNDGSPVGNRVGSVAATGFGLTTLCIAASRGWVRSDQAQARILTTLRYFWAHAFHDHGWYYHFLDASNGKRKLASEISSVDTSWFLCGVLTAAGCFSGNREIQTLAHQIFERVEFDWM